MKNLFLFTKTLGFKKDVYVMPKGKKTNKETIYKVMLSYITTGNYSETARQLDMPESTIRKIVDDNKNKEEFAKLCEEKRNEFIAEADKIINKATKLLNKRLDIALENQDELEEIISDVYNTDNKEISEQQKKSMVKKIAKLQINGLSEITTAIGTMYDKRALAKGEPTSNEFSEIRVNIVDD